MIRFFRNFGQGLFAYVDGIRLIFTSMLWWTFIVPLLLSVGLYFGGEFLIDALQQTSFSDIDPEDGSRYLLIGVQSILVYVAIYLNKYLVLMLLPPLLAWMSTRVEYLLTGNTYPLILKYYLEDIRRAIMLSLRNLSIQIAIMAVGFLIFRIYGLPLDWVVLITYPVAFYFYGFAFMDYVNERRRLTIRESVRFVRRHAGAALALGGVYGGLFFIPYAGIVIAPILGIVAGTVCMNQLVDLRENEHAIRSGDAPVNRVAEEEEAESEAS